jgi:hypothetical protein
MEDYYHEQLKKRCAGGEMTDLIYRLQKLDRFNPSASFSMTANSWNSEPHVSVTASMNNTRTIVSAGDGSWIKYDDVLHMIIKAQEYE